MSKSRKIFYSRNCDSFNIPKQTLLYYDRIGLLSPEFIAENGYRHYSLTQYLILEIIVNLRKLDIPISQIKDYLNHKSSDKFNELIHKKSCECDEIINKHIKIKHSLAFVDKLLSNIENLALNQITLEHQSEQIIFISDLSSVAVGKKRLEIMAKHNQKAFNKQHFKEKAVGWIVDQKIFNGRKKLFTSIFTTVGHPQNINKNHMILPEGLYLNIFFKGTYHKIQNLFQKNCLILNSNEL
ncbi:MAG: MerR family transcriptional regulator [Phascolarctobacterium faecium]